jgi:ABC-2 type transport system permease protein
MIGPRLGAILVKELLAILRDPRSRMILIVPPLMQFVVFGFAVTLEVTNIGLGVVNLDGGPWSQEIIERVEGSPNVRSVVALPSDAAARVALDRQQVVGVLRFAPQFSADVTKGRGVVGAVFDGRRSNAAQIVAGYVDRIVADVSAEATPAGTPSGGSSVAINWFNANLDYRWFTMPALIAIISAIMTLSVVAQSVARERELGTFDQLMVSPLRVHEILIGKIVPPMLVGAFVVTAYVILIPLTFGVTRTGSLALLYLGLVFYLAAMSGVGMLISTVAATQQQAFLGMFLVAVPTIMLSGFASPIDNMPGWLQVIARADPVGYFLTISEGVFLKAMPLNDVLANCWPLAIIAAVTLTAASLLFRSRMEG